MSIYNKTKSLCSSVATLWITGAMRFAFIPSAGNASVTRVSSGQTAARHRKQALSSSPCCIHRQQRQVPHPPSIGCGCRDIGYPDVNHSRRAGRGWNCPRCCNFWRMWWSVETFVHMESIISRLLVITWGIGFVYPLTPAGKHINDSWDKDEKHNGG